jgi:hypothetical protein
MNRSTKKKKRNNIAFFFAQYYQNMLDKNKHVREKKDDLSTFIREKK